MCVAAFITGTKTNPEVMSARAEHVHDEPYTQTSGGDCT